MGAKHQLRTIDKKVDEFMKKNLDRESYNRKKSIDLPVKIEEVMNFGEKCESKLDQILGAVPDPIFTRDNDRNIIFWSKSVAELTGYSEQEALKMKCDEVFRASVCNDCVIEKCLKDRSTVKNEEIKIKDKDNKEIVVLASASGLYDESGNPEGGLEIFREITKEKRLLENIQKVAEEVSPSAEEVSASSEEVSSSVEELASSSSEVNDLTKTGKETTDKANEQAGEGQKAASEAIEKMNAIEEAVGQSTR